MRLQFHSQKVKKVSGFDEAKFFEIAKFLHYENKGNPCPPRRTFEMVRALRASNKRSFKVDSMFFFLSNKDFLKKVAKSLFV